jgi:hypothetical protein
MGKRTGRKRTNVNGEQKKEEKESKIMKWYQKQTQTSSHANEVIYIDGVCASKEHQKCYTMRNNVSRPIACLPPLDVYSDKYQHDSFVS